MRGPRPRRTVSPIVVKILSPFFRYSHVRDAYVLRIVGGRYGPVLRPGLRRRSLRATD